MELWNDFLKEVTCLFMLEDVPILEEKTSDLKFNLEGKPTLPFAGKNFLRFSSRIAMSKKKSAVYFIAELVKVARKSMAQECNIGAVRMEKN